MSHYLNFYIKSEVDKFDSEEVKKKKETQEPLFLFYYGGSSNVYQRFRDNNIQCYLNNDIEYKELTVSDINSIIEDIKSDIKKVTLRVNTLERCKLASSDIVEDLISSKEYLEELNEELTDIEFLATLRDKLNWNSNKLLFNNN